MECILCRVMRVEVNVGVHAEVVITISYFMEVRGT